MHFVDVEEPVVCFCERMQALEEEDDRVVVALKWVVLCLLRSSLRGQFARESYLCSLGKRYSVTLVRQAVRLEWPSLWVVLF